MSQSAVYEIQTEMRLIHERNIFWGACIKWWLHRLTEEVVSELRVKQKISELESGRGRPVFKGAMKF